MPAGGFRTFVAGEVLDEGDINDYLMQGILVFGGTAARGSAIGTAVEGQFAFLTDSDTLTYFDGSSWVDYEAGYPQANISATTGSPGTGTFTDGNGISWNYYKWTGGGSLTIDIAGFVDALVVGGGGGSAKYTGRAMYAGGGAGAVRYGLVYLTAGTYTVTVGSGGAGDEGNPGNASDGGSSVLGSMTSGGGEGGFAAGGFVSFTKAGKNGGGSPAGFHAQGDDATTNGGSAGTAANTGINLNYDGSVREYGSANGGAANTGSGGTLSAGSGTDGVVIVKVLA